MDCNINELVGKTITEIDGGKDSSELTFHTLVDGDYRMRHDQDCCENVSIEDIIGDLKDIVGSPILTAEESSSSDSANALIEEGQDSFTWTFYKLATIKGSVTIRWFGCSNGYYSEGVDFGKA